MPKTYLFEHGALNIDDEPFGFIRTHLTAEQVAIVDEACLDYVTPAEIVVAGIIALENAAAKAAADERFEASEAENAAMRERPQRVADAEVIVEPMFTKAEREELKDYLLSLGCGPDALGTTISITVATETASPAA